MIWPEANKYLGSVEGLPALLPSSRSPSSPTLRSGQWMYYCVPYIHNRITALPLGAPFIIHPPQHVWTWTVGDSLQVDSSISLPIYVILPPPSSSSSSSKARLEAYENRPYQSLSRVENFDHSSQIYHVNTILLLLLRHHHASRHSQLPSVLTALSLIFVMVVADKSCKSCHPDFLTL